MIKIDENDPIGEVDPSFPFRDVVIRRNTDMKEFYDLQKEIGRGKFGTVYRCTEKSTGLKLAAKFIGISKRQDRRNAEREVEIMRELQHPRLIQMYDAFEINNIMCVVLELIEGGELFERVIDDDFILTEKSVSVFMRQICEGIAFIHSKNILHLDMKPENILCLTKTGNRIKIIDFGLARKYDPEKKLQVLFGTPEFVAPEVVNFDSIGFGTDMWSVGVICYVLLSGLSPFMGETDVQTMANVTIAQYDFDDEAFNDISTDAKDFIGKLLLKDREQRMSATECLSHRWLQRRKPPVSSIPPSIPNSQSELDLQRDTLRYLVDRWNNDTNIALDVNNDDDKCDKVIDICKMNGIAEQQSKSQNEFVCKQNSLAANDTTTAQSAIKYDSSVEIAEKPETSGNTTLVPIQTIEAPPVSNQVLKSLPDAISTDKPTFNSNKRSLSPDTNKIESGKKDQNTKISKSASPSRSGSSSPVISEQHKLLNGAFEHSQELPKSSLLEVPTKSLQKQSSDIKKFPSTSPQPSKKPVTKMPSPSIKDQTDEKDELITNQAESIKEQSSQKLLKSPSLLEIPKKVPRMEPADMIKSPSASPKPLKKTPVKTPSPTIKDHQADEKDELITNQAEIIKEQYSQKLLKSPSLLEIPKKVPRMESADATKSSSTSPKPLKKTPVKTPSPTIKDHQADEKDELITTQRETTKEQSSQKLPKSPSLLEIPKKVPRMESANATKSSSTSPKPLKKTPVKTSSPTIKDHQADEKDELITTQRETTKEQSSQKLPKSPSLLEIPKKVARMESADVTKSSSTSPKPLKKTLVKTPSPTIKDHQVGEKDELMTQEESTKEQSSQKLPKSPSLLEIPKKVARMESADATKSSSTSPKPLKKIPVKTSSPTIKDQQPDYQDELIPNQAEITNDKSSQESSKPSLLEIPQKSAQTETSNTKKSPSTSPKPLKKKPVKTPSPLIHDQQSDHQDEGSKPTSSVTLDKSLQRDASNGKKSPITVPQQTINFAKINVSEFQEEVVDKRSSTSDATICDAINGTVIGDKTSKSINSEDGAVSVKSNSNISQENVGKSKKESNIRDSKNICSSATLGAEFAQGNGNENTKSKDKLRDIPSADPTSQSQSSRTPTVEISDETYEYVKKRRFTIKSVESTKTADKGDSTSHTKSIEKTATAETSPQPQRRSIFSPEVSPKVLRKLNDFMSTSELMKRRISDISNLLSRRTENDIEQSIPDEMNSFCSKLNRIVRLRHDSYSIDGSSNFKRPKFRISYFSRDVPLASTPPLHADLLNYLPFNDETIATPVWSFQKTNPFHSDPSSLRNSPERFASPSLTKKLLSKFFNDSLEYDISSTPSTSTNGLPKDKITGIIS